MNTKTPILAGVAIAFCLLLASCSGAPEHLNVIPDNASMVYNVQFTELAAKGRIDKLMESQMMKDIMEEVDRESTDMSEDMRDFFTNPFNLGLDFTESPYAFMAKEEGSNFFGVTMNLSSQEKFKTFLDKMAAEARVELDTREEGEITFYESTEGFGMVPTIGIKNDVALIVMPIPDYYSESEPASGAEIITDCFALAEGSRIVSTPEFKQFVDDQGDINFWMNQGAYLDMTGAMMFMPPELKEITDLIDDNVVAYHMSFEDGEVEVKMRNHMTGEMKNIVEQIYNDGGVDGDLLKYLPEETMACVSASINPEGFDSVLDLFRDMPDYERAESEIDRETGFKIRELLSIVGGDVVASFQGIEMMEVEVIDYNQPNWWDDPQYIMEDQPMPVFTVAVSVGDAEVLDKVMGLIPEGAFEADGDLLIIKDDVTVYMYHNEDVFLFSSSKDVALAAADGGPDDNLGDSKLASKMKDNASFGYIDLNPERWPSNLVSMIEEEQMGRTALDYLSRLDYFEAVSTNGFSAEAHLYFTESDNALVTIWSTADEAYQEFN
jgi:hypothetical protein